MSQPCIFCFYNGFIQGYANSVLINDLFNIYRLVSCLVLYSWCLFVGGKVNK